MVQIPTTRSEWVYERLKEAILSGKIAPEERIVVDQIAREFGTSAIPVREAIRRLEAEGWVENKPFVGARVAPVRIEELEELLSIRLALEPILARTAVLGATNETIDRLEQLVEEMDKCIDHNDTVQYSRLNYEFHRLLYELSPWKELFRIVISVWERSARSRWIFVQTPDSMLASQQEHRAMMEAFRNRDAKELERQMRLQKERSFDLYMSYIKNKMNECASEDS
ncbi:GntR family transcriptional regulator [Effusibacillus lacus]|uniref:GntR family transcriptional regulator n=1 Tax=Effusibacillus lacus TaxID=1348429 RepID=A0A292YJK5_9BACL|nr:GntR family transcriptional regulator [Effusibacillus lacus]TCS76958.1 GntR family transcriptional regulator [Effusibacillus lacus]GAX91287.1 GntR family transcriptional regulator [Effusibacillus lacus]